MAALASVVVVLGVTPRALAAHPRQDPPPSGIAAPFAPAPKPRPAAGTASGDAAPAPAPVVVEERPDPMREATLDVVEAIEDTSFGAWLRDHQAAWNALAIAALFAIGFLLHLAICRVLSAVATRALEKAHRTAIADAIRRSKVIPAIASIVPILLVARLIDLLGDAGVLNLIVARNIANLTLAFAIVRGMVAASRGMAIADELYSSRPEVNRPGALRGYRQVGMVVIAFVGGISAAAIAVGKSPLVFLAALGAVAAVIGVVFKDVLFSLVANLMLTANDAIRVGDWVEMKQHQIDGRIAEIKTTSVRVQNADGTVHSVPISRFVQEPWLNYRSRYGPAGRRMRRSFRVDLRTVRALDAQELARLDAASGIAGAAARARAAAKDAPVTNLCAFRAALECMLASHSAVDSSLPVVVSQQEATASGVPVDLLAFIRPDAGPDLANIEGALLDRVSMSAPAFGLRLYQSLGDAPPPAAPLAFLAEADLAAAGMGGR
jgi:miniconductance mechanosensitive channel